MSHPVLMIWRCEKCGEDTWVPGELGEGLEVQSDGRRSYVVCGCGVCPPMRPTLRCSRCGGRLLQWDVHDYLETGVG